jgi:DNA-binding NarL/FixJ family response regulator
VASAIRVLIADDHTVVRRGLRTFLQVQDGIEVVGEAGDAAGCLAEVERLRPDVLLLDLRLPDRDGVEVLRSLAGDRPRVLVVTSFTELTTTVPAVRAGAAGVVYKDVSPAALAGAIRSVHAGHAVLPPDLVAALARGEAGPRRLGQLTPREREVLAEIARGRSNREIARSLVVSEKTVKTHVSSILAKLDVADRTQAALYAVRHAQADGEPVTG